MFIKKVSYELYGFCRRNCSKAQTNEARSRCAPKKLTKEHLWEQRIKYKLLSRDATHGTNYYEQYLMRKARIKARRNAMGDRAAHGGFACCVIL